MSLVLAQKLVEAGLVTPARMDDALQRQVIYGGSLDTNLLELGLLDENRLLEAMGEVHHLPLATAELIGGRDLRVLNLFPPRLAEKYRLVPVRVSGRTLQVVVCSRPHPVVQEEISFLLSLEVKPFLVVEARLLGLLHQWCGIALEARYADLLDRLGPFGASAPAASQPPHPAPQEIPDRQRMDPLLSRLEEERLGEQQRREQARSGRLSLEIALEELERVTEREQLVNLLLRFARQVSPFVALLVVSGDSILGWDAVAADDDIARVKQLRLPLGMSSILSPVILSRSVYLGPVTESAGNNALLAALGRKRPHSAFVVPLQVKNRLVGLLYGDAGPRPIPPERLSALVAFTSRLAEAFRRLILRKKKEARGSWKKPAVETAPAVVEMAEQAAQRLLADQPTTLLETEPAAKDVSPSEPERRLVERPVVIEPLPSSLRMEEDKAPTTPAKESPVVLEPLSPAAQLASEPEPPPAVDIMELDFGGQPVTAPPSAKTETPPPSAEPTREKPNDAVATWQMPDAARLAEQLSSPNPEVASLAADALATLEAQALPHLMRLFPGRLYFDVRGAHDHVPPLAEHGPLIRCLLEIGGEAAALAVAEHLEDPQPLNRYYALRVLGEICLPRLVPRISERFGDSDALVRLTAVDTLQSYRGTPEFESILQDLRRQLEDPRPERQALAAALLGNFRDLQALPLLAGLVRSPERMVARAAREALVYITKQDFGARPKKWLSWWQAHRREKRVRWLIRGLSSENRDIRFTSARELFQLTGETFGYFFDSDRASRRGAVKQWERWWQQEGQFLRFEE